jgi:hypothetical protein
LLIWSSRHEKTGAPCEVIEKMARRRSEVLAEVRRRWRERDPSPLLPWLSGGTGSKAGAESASRLASSTAR